MENLVDIYILAAGTFAVVVLVVAVYLFFTQ